MMQLLKRGFTERQLLEIIYISSKQKITHRTIIIYRIDDTSIQAYCYLRKQKRTFLIENILSVSPHHKKVSKNIG
ncbi:hypothetical protein LS684_06365 [Cytobacillus spongiae]|uniref:hypothetical protein n=1 Tax=Cytobacillus spongiae TaxID=2901381 RepID=UPI001F18C232|nr:hypothetical protein [Cytobacillus spongiae]UII57060.1 hypothetical protein LS684_06365 [Cytobacillus spongiae]